MSKKEKKKMSRLKKVILIVVITVGVLLLAAGGFALVMYLKYLPALKWKEKYDFMLADTGYTTVNTTLTEEQRLKDFDYMYDLVCLQNPKKELFEQAYGISYDDIYQKYKNYVINAKTEYEYFSYLSAFLAVLPGEHNYMGLPNYVSNVDTGFCLTEMCATQEMKDYVYSWREDFRDDVARYDDCGIIAFTYVDGKYLGIGSGTSATTKKVVSDHAGGILVSIDGKDPKEKCFDFLDIYPPRYDSGNGCFFRETLVFNDSVGEKHEAEILMPDGSKMSKELYVNPGFELAFLEKSSTYPPEKSSSGEGASSGAVVTDIWDAAYVPKSYKLAEDPGRHLVYLDTYDCDRDEGLRLVVDLNKAIEHADADTVILDLRNNTGGERDYCIDQLLPALFHHDVDCKIKVVGKKNDYTENYYESKYYSSVMDRPLEFDGEYFYYTEDFDVKGQATRDLKLYVLTSSDTFSSGDILTQICKLYDNAVIIGTNTGGEGICGSPFNCYLPESHFIFVYVPTVNTTSPENSYRGTEPDIYVHYTVEEETKRRELRDQGVDVSAYEERMQWDQTLLKVLEMADSD